MTDAIEEDGMAVEEEQGTERVVEPDVTVVEPEAASDADPDDDIVDAHVWRAQS